METIVKRQKAKIGVAGSFFNQLMSNNCSIPVVGKGATIMHYSDRDVAEVLEVSADGKRVILESLVAEWDKSLPGGEGHQNWIFKPTSRKFKVVWKWGAWRTVRHTFTYCEEFVNKCAENGVIMRLSQCLTEEQKADIYQGQVYPQKAVPGITKSTTEYHKIRILFGEKNYYYDWEF